MPSLADLPFDVLHLIGEFIQPATISIPSLLSSTSATPWIEWGRDLYSFSSTCRVIWSATRGLTGRKYGFHGRTVSREEEERDALRRLETLKGAGSGQKVGPFETCATKLRHFYFRTCLPSFFLDHSALFVDKVSLMSNLASIAIVYKTEDAVVATSPYSTTPLPADVVRALAQLANLRSLYLGGIKLTGLRDSFEASRCRFGSHVKTLVLRAVHDTALLLLPLVPSATRISLWRDFAHHPRIVPSSWWQEHSWDCVEDLELYGFSGIQGRALMCTLVDSLLVSAHHACLDSLFEIAKSLNASQGPFPRFNCDLSRCPNHSSSLFSTRRSCKLSRNCPICGPLPCSSGTTRPSVPR